MSNFKTLQRCFLVLAGFAVFISGCAKPAEETSRVQETKPQVDLAKHSREEKQPQHELVGVWLGKGALDQNSLAIAIQGLSPETQRQLNAKAETFLTTEMAIEFKVDGTMETAVEVINKLGMRDSGVSLSTWEASRTVNRGEYRVTSVEDQSDGSKVTDHKIYRVSADGQNLELLVDLEGLLGQCNPRIVLQRQDENPSVAANNELQIR